MSEPAGGPAAPPLAHAVAARWPGIAVDVAGLDAALAERELDRGSPHAADVALALALAAGDAPALALFERCIAPDLVRGLARLDQSGDLATEALQRMRAKLFVRSPDSAAPARVSEYRGRGSLAAWLQVIAIREALMLRRDTRRETTTVGVEDALLVAVESDPTLALTKHAFRSRFAEVFRTSLAALEPRERALLRLTFVDGAGTEKLAAMYGVHRVTMFRWLADARARLLERVRAGVEQELGVAADDVDSLIRAVASSLDVHW